MARIDLRRMREELMRRARSVTPEDIDRVLNRRGAIEGKFIDKAPLRRFLGDARALFSMINDYRRGRYRSLPWTTIAAAVGALLYVLSPIDVLPDFIPGLGLMDDAVVIGLCLKAIRSDLEDYLRWKRAAPLDGDG